MKDSSDGRSTLNDLFLDAPVDLGYDQGRGNLVGIQPFLTPADYASETAFQARLTAYLDAAAAAGWLNLRSVVVFPEYTGTWLVAVDEVHSVYQAASTGQAMGTLARRHPFAFLKVLLASRERDRLTAGLFRLKSQQAASVYQRVFSRLASQFEVTIVAGSILLPDPAVREGVVVAGDGPLYNVSAVFQPDGSAHPYLVRKVFPISGELPFVHPGQVEELPIFETPAGRLGVLICADSWYPATYRRMAQLQAELLAVPSFISSDDAWEQPWGGYDGATAPADVDPADVHRLTEGQAWRKYALAGRMVQADACCGVNVFLHGALWELGSNSGQSVIVVGKQAYETQSQKAALLNLWLDGSHFWEKERRSYAIRR